MMTVVYVYIAYFALNLYHTPSLSSMTCITDTQGKLHPKFKRQFANQGANDKLQKGEEDKAAKYPPYSILQKMEGYEDDYIPPLYDLPVSLINQAVFGNHKNQDAGG